ncbi:MAG: DUF4197 domain-containing protein [Bdellovibrionales bacterium]
MKKTAALIVTTLTLSACVTGGANVSNDGWGTQIGTVIDTQTLQNIFGAGGQSNLSALTNADIIAGLKEALEIGTQNVVGQLGVLNGFNADPKIHIPLPSTLQKVDNVLSAVGMNTLTADLETRLNRAAEAATPKAKQYFITAIKNMTFSDAKAILQGPNDAATQYLRRAMGPQIKSDMQPVIQNALAQAGAIQAYDSVMGRYAQIPFMPDVKADLQNYVSDKALDGIFYYVAREEAAIRENPAARTTTLLQKVFAARS